MGCPLGGLRTLRVGGSEATSGRSAPGGRLPGGGPLSSVGGSVGTAAGWALPRGFPPGPGRGSRLSLEKARTQRVAGEGPRPPGLGAARSHSLVLAIVPHCSGRGAIPLPIYVP